MIPRRSRWSNCSARLCCFLHLRNITNPDDCNRNVYIDKWCYCYYIYIYLVRSKPSRIGHKHRFYDLDGRWLCGRVRALNPHCITRIPFTCASRARLFCAFPSSARTPCDIYPTPRPRNIWIPFLSFPIENYFHKIKKRFIQITVSNACIFCIFSTPSIHLSNK